MKLPSLPQVPSLPSLPALPNITNIFPTLPAPQESPESIRVGDPADPFFRDVEQPIIPVQPEGSTVRINQNEFGDVTTIFEGGREILGPAGEVIPPERPLSLSQFGLTPAELFAQEQRGRDLSVPTDVENAQFQGGGPSFVGGSVSEIPISRLSLGDIIDRFGVSASQAADIRSRATDDFGDFDFGTNTGSGIGSVVAEDAELRTSLPNPGAVSDPRFEGKTAEEIASELTGGLISNF